MAKRSHPARRSFTDTRGRRPSRRRVFDRDILEACTRWAVLRRHPEYQRDVMSVVEDDARAMGKDPQRVLSLYLEDQGVVCSPSDLYNSDRYEALCQKWGVRMLFLPGRDIPYWLMAAYPIFADTPRRQLVFPERGTEEEKHLRKLVLRSLKPREVLGSGSPKALLDAMESEDRRRVADGLPPLPPDVSPRTSRRYLRRQTVQSGPFQLPASGRRHHLRVPRQMAVFDARRKGESFPLIAKRLGISVDQAKRDWKAAKLLIPQWIDLEQHFASCRECALAPTVGRYCKEVELQIAIPLTGTSRATAEDGLDRYSRPRMRKAPAPRS